MGAEAFHNCFRLKTIESRHWANEFAPRLDVSFIIKFPPTYAQMIRNIFAGKTAVTTSPYMPALGPLDEAQIAEMQNDWDGWIARWHGIYDDGFVPSRGSIEEDITYAGFPLPDVDWDQVYQDIANA